VPFSVLLSLTSTSLHLYSTFRKKYRDEGGGGVGGRGRDEVDYAPVLLTLRVMVSEIAALDIIVFHCFTSV